MEAKSKRAQIFKLGKPLVHLGILLLGVVCSERNSIKRYKFKPMMMSSSSWLEELSVEPRVHQLCSRCKDHKALGDLLKNKSTAKVKMNSKFKTSNFTVMV